MSKQSRLPRNLRFYAAMVASKAAVLALKATHHAGGQMPGVVATKICPDVLGRLEMPKHVIVVTGTNGKTTTSNLIADILTSAGEKPLINRMGGNVTEGVISTLLKGSTVGGKARAKYAVLELDERCSKFVFPYLTPEVLVVTNLYRDTFTRNSHVGFVFDVLSRAIPSDTTLLANADDLISSRLAPQTKSRVYYSMQCALPSDTQQPSSLVNDLNACPVCGGHLTYKACHLGHIGQLACDSCGCTNPGSSFDAVSVDYDTNTICVRENNAADATVGEYHFSAGSVTDLYNLLAAISCARTVGISVEKIAHALNNGVGIVEVRYDETVAGGKRLVRIAAKGENAMASSRGYANIKRQPGPKAVILMSDNNHLAKNVNEAEYVGWIYETDFELLADDDIKQIVVTGIHCEDLVLRLLLAGVESSRIATAKDGISAADCLDFEHVDSIYFSHAVDNYWDAKKAFEHLADLLNKKEVA